MIFGGENNGLIITWHLKMELDDMLKKTYIERKQSSKQKSEQP